MSLDPREKDSSLLILFLLLENGFLKEMAAVMLDENYHDSYIGGTNDIQYFVSKIIQIKRCFYVFVSLFQKNKPLVFNFPML